MRAPWAMNWASTGLRSISPSARAANTATVMGRLNLTQPLAVTGKLLLNAEALDDAVDGRAVG